MKNRCALFLIVIVSLFLAVNTLAGGTTHWGYSGHEGPANWGGLDPAFRLCAEGKNQSPIDLAGMIDSKLSPIAFNYQPGGNEIVNNGHSVQVNYTPGSTIAVVGREFELKQFHFHSPSENTIEGQSYPMEAHLVHADKHGNLAVIAVLYQIGKKNSELEKAWAHMPGQPDEKRALPRRIDANYLLPHDRDYYRFNGSLTTPPCSEGVWWLVMKQVAMASKEQIEIFSRTMGHPNNRPLQPVNARTILK